MSRLLMLIAVLFAFASVGGASASYAHGGQMSHGVFGAAVEQDDTCAAAEPAAKIVAYKPCTKKLNGIAIPCPHQPLLVPVALAAAPAPDVVAGPVLPAATRFCAGPEAERQFRPPRV